ncbi:MAG: nuclear transport factor 2 family protein [Bacteroidota bacterium]
MISKFKHSILVFFFIGPLPFILHGQHAQMDLPSNLEDIIRKTDARFWQSYNTCNLDMLGTFLTEDLEFYHDRDGLTTTATGLLKLVAQGICGNTNVHLRREEVLGSVSVFPLNHYGAIITGEHLFYLKEKGKTEKLIEKARFTHVWKWENNKWRMSRVLSYDHQKVSENSNKQSIVLSPETLAQLTGKYQAPNTGLVTISLSSDNTLHIKAGQMNAQLHAETKTRFFVKEAPLTFEFVKNDKREIKKFIVRESGTIVEEAKKMN